MQNITTPFSVYDETDIGRYIYTDDGTNQMLYLDTDGKGAPTNQVIEHLILSNISQFDGREISSRTKYEVYNKVLDKSQINKMLGASIEIIDARTFLALNGSLSTTPGGTRTLVNSKGGNVIVSSGKVLKFNGTNQKITLSDVVFTSTTSWTLGFTSFGQMLNNKYFLKLNSTNRRLFLSNGNLSFYNGNVIAKLFDGNPIGNKIISCDGVNIKSYLNGVFQYSIDSASITGLSDIVEDVTNTPAINNVFLGTFSITQEEITYQNDNPELFYYKEGATAKSGVLEQSKIDAMEFYAPMQESDNSIINIVTNTSYPITNYDSTMRTNAYHSNGVQSIFYKPDMTYSYYNKVVVGGVEPYDPIPKDPEMPSFSGTAYYVDASTTGTEVGTIENPFKTLSQAGFIANPQAGDAVLFKRGETFVGRLATRNAGDATADILYGAYGEGAKPIITDIIDQPLTWNSIGGNIWESVEDVNTAIHRIYRNNVEIMKAHGTEVLGDTLPALCEWTFNGTKLQVYGDPTNDTFQFASELYVIDPTTAGTKNYLTFYGLDIRGGVEAGIFGSGVSHHTYSYCNISEASYYGARLKSGASNVIFHNCMIDSKMTLNYKEAGIGAESLRGAREGIYLSDTCDSVTFLGNYFKNHTHSALNYYANGGTITNTKILYNYFTSPDIPYGGRIALMGDHQGYEIAYNRFENQFGAREQLEGSGGHIHHNTWINVKDSLIDTAGGESVCIRMGTFYVHTHDNIIENNLFYDCDGGIDIGGTSTFASGKGLELVTIQNNIFYECSTKAIYNSVPIFVRNGKYTDYTKNVTIQNNISYSSVNNLFGNFIGNYYDTDRVDVTQFEIDGTSKGSIVQNNITADPLLDTDYFLKNGSPCIGAGVLPTSTKSYSDTTITHGTIGSGYDIGLYNQGEVYIAPSTVEPLMYFKSGDAPQHVQDLVVGQPLSIKETMKNGVVYLWTYDGTTQKLYKDGLAQTNETITAVNIGQISRLNGELESEIDTFELFNKVIKA